MTVTDYDPFCPPEEVDVVIDTPRGSFLKRRDDGRIDFVSPLPSPFNYGSVPGSLSPDGDRIDVMVLGPRLGRGSRVRVAIVAIARFVDAGVPDPKWIASDSPLSSLDRAGLTVFFRTYVLLKRLLYARRGQTGVTRYEGLLPRAPR